MIGPTGVGKTEIARRLARLANAPFIKVEATKFTEVGYVGRDVDSIIRDLAEIGVKQTREQEMAKVRSPGRGCRRGAHARRAAAAGRDGSARRPCARRGENGHAPEVPQDAARGRARRPRDRDRRARAASGHGDHGAARHGGTHQQLQGMFQNLGSGRRKPRKLKVREAMQAAHRRGSGEARQRRGAQDAARSKNVEQNGIVFIDEIDKIARQREPGGRRLPQGVQRDLLPLVEGSTVSTKYGMIKTDHILFIAQRRLPHVEAVRPDPRAAGPLPDPRRADALSTDDFERILTEPDACLADRQYEALLATEGVTLDIPADGIRRSPRSRGRSTSAPRTSVRAASTR
jgi:ATP-dependent HslUV protease ATP-binding subunit HslU